MSDGMNSFATGFFLLPVMAMGAFGIDEYQHYDAERFALQNDGCRGLFIRSMVGLDRAAAKEAFNTFIEKYNPGSDKIEFLNMVIDYLTERGVMDPCTLYESPFTDLDNRRSKAFSTRLR